MDRARTFGLLMPVSALPSKEGIGTFGKSAYRFIDFLKSSGASIWQVLPLVPTNYGDSPYQSCCSTALNYYFIDLETLIAEGLLTRGEVDAADLKWCDRRVDYGKQFYNKIPLLRQAFARFDRTDAQFVSFVRQGKYADFAVFMALKCKFGHRAWTEWDEKYKHYDEEVIVQFASDNAEEILFWTFTQYISLEQWNALKEYAHGCGIEIMGDIPLYLAYDSVEMWKYGDSIFKVDENRVPSKVAGVPPDAFTDDGQLWGNPLYDWAKMQKGGFKWWNCRLSDSLSLFDIIRIDHFRGFDRYYAIPAGAPNARQGIWEDGPKESLFEDKLEWNIVAEDLGVIDDGVRRLMKNLGYPGMKILEFAFDGSPDNEHKPSNHTENFVCYTGTHDNMPLKQYIADLPENELKTFKCDLQAQCGLLNVKPDLESAESMCKTIVELAFASRSFAVIFPVSDLLAMDGQARMNLPATVSSDNWSFRFRQSELSDELCAWLNDMAKRTGRLK